MPLFQAQVYPQQAPGVEGDFCDHNPRATVDAGPGGLVAHAEGVTVARFGWLEYSIIDPNNAPAIVRTKSTGGQPAGFIHREQQGLITNYLGGVGMIVPGGFPLTLHQAGGFFVLNRGATYAAPGMKAYARLSDGAVMFGATGGAPGAATFVGSIAAAAAITATGSIANNVLTVTASTGAPIVPGTTLTGPPGVAAGTRVVSQLTGTTGGVGTYSLSIANQTVVSGAVAGTYGILTVTAITPPGAIEVGDVLSGGTTVAGTMVTALGTGTGGLGTYYVDNNTVVAAPTTASDAFETKWFATSGGNVNEIVKMSSWVLG